MRVRAKDRSRSGTGILEGVGQWRDRLARHYEPGEGGAPGLCSLDLNGVFEFDEAMVIDGAHLLMLVENRIEGSVSDFWHLWARWFLQRMGLPAPEDFGERTGGDVHPAARLDTEPSRLFRVAQRFPLNTAESWAARIEWRFLTGLDGGAAGEVARFVGTLRALEMLPDAKRGSDAAQQRARARRIANEKKTKAALKRDGQWAGYLKRGGLFPVGVGGSVKDAITALANRFKLDYESVRETLKKRRAVPESPLFAPSQRATKKGKA